MTAIDDYEKRSKESDYWVNQEKFFYGNLESAWKSEAVKGLTHPLELYSDRALLLNVFSENQFDWKQHMELPRYAEAKLSKLKATLPAAVMEWVKSDESTNLVFVGDNNTGKTYAAVAACRYLTLHGFQKSPDSLFMPKSRMLQCVDAHNLLDGWSKDQDAAGAVERFKEAPLLLLDDVGAVATSSQATVANIVAVLSHRYNVNLPTVVTSNVDSDGLVALYGSTAMRRVFNENVVVHKS